MNENIKDLVNAMLAKDANGTQAAFQAAMAEKISAKLDDMRVNIAHAMFNVQQEEQPEISEEDPEATE